MGQSENLANIKYRIRIGGKNIKFYREMGVDCNFGDYIEVYAHQLAPTSRTVVKAKCSFCGKICETQHSKTRHKMGFICSAACRNKRTSLSLFEKYGVTNISMLPEVKKKRIESVKEKYGVENISQLKETRQKIEESNLKKYGVKNVSGSKEIKDKKKETTRKNFGVDAPSQSEIVRTKQIKTMIKKYGVDNCSKIPNIMDKKIETGIKSKEYSLPSGRIINIMGYESFGLDYLFSKGIREEDLLLNNEEIFNEIGVICYNDPVLHDKERRYFPDFYQKSKKIIYEVKSVYTKTLNEQTVLAKKEACLSLGYNYCFLVFNNKGKIIAEKVDKAKRFLEGKG